MVAPRQLGNPWGMQSQVQGNGTPAPYGPFGGAPPMPAQQSTAYPGLTVHAPLATDPAFQPPAHPLKDREALKNRARVIMREIPNVVVQVGWSPATVRTALTDLVVGLFDRPDQLQDAIASDSRVQSAMQSRSGGLLAAPVRFKPANYPKDPKLARKVCDRWERHWPHMHCEPALRRMLENVAMLGFSYAQLIWDTNGSTWLPYMQDFAARYSYYHWVWRLHMAVTLDGQYPVTGGDGHWVMHAPYGGYRGWMRGALRAVSSWWLARNYALRDWARYSERHGFPMVLADTPFGADPQDIASYQGALTAVGQETVLQLPGSVDVNQYGKYDLRYLEPKDAAWQGFKDLIGQCNDEITLALLGQNLTSQVREGSLAAARVHADVRQDILQSDARALAKTLHVQVMRPFAALNYDDPDLAPTVEWDLRPEEDLHVKSQGFQAFSAAVAQLRNAGVIIENLSTFARRFGLVGLEVTKVPPTQIQAQLARATGDVKDVNGPTDVPGPGGDKESGDDQ